MTVASGQVIEAKINDRWPVKLLPHREEFHRVRPKWELGRLESCAERMRPGMTVYDVGAEEGDFTVLYRLWVGNHGDVVPIEPQPAYWPAIRATWEGNGLPPPRAWFPGFAGGETTVHEHTATLADLGWPDDPWPTCSKGRIRPDFGFLHLSQQAESTPQLRLDAFADLSRTPPDAIVMDIEGAEIRALEGCEYLCTGPNPPLLWVSVHEPTMLDWYGATLDDLLGLMAGYGYSAEELPQHGEIETFWFFEPRR